MNRIPPYECEDLLDREILVEHLKRIGPMSHLDFRKVYGFSSRARMPEARERHSEIKERWTESERGRRHKIFYWERREDDPLANADPEELEQGNLLGEVV